MNDTSPHTAGSRRALGRSRFESTAVRQRSLDGRRPGRARRAPVGVGHCLRRAPAVVLRVRWPASVPAPPAGDPCRCRLAARTQAAVESRGFEAGRVSWEAMNLRYVTDEPPEPPDYLDLVYRGRRHWFSGPPESLKTLVAYAVMLAATRRSECVALIDFEMGERDARNRLREMGATDGDLDLIEFYAPESPPTKETLRAIAHRCSLVVIDAAAGAYQMYGLHVPVRPLDPRHHMGPPRGDGRTHVERSRLEADRLHGAGKPPYRRQGPNDAHGVLRPWYRQEGTPDHRASVPHRGRLCQRRRVPAVVPQGIQGGRRRFPESQPGPGSSRTRE